MKTVLPAAPRSACRSRVDCAHPHPDRADRAGAGLSDGKDTLSITLDGALAGILGLAAKAKGPRFGRRVALVSARELERTRPFQPHGKLGPSSLRRETRLPASPAH